jgi:hypothetical protein
MTGMDHKGLIFFICLSGSVYSWYMAVLVWGIWIERYVARNGGKPAHLLSHSSQELACFQITARRDGSPRSRAESPGSCDALNASLESAWLGSSARWLTYASLHFLNTADDFNIDEPFHIFLAGNDRFNVKE